MTHKKIFLGKIFIPSCRASFALQNGIKINFLKKFLGVKIGVKKTFLTKKVKIFDKKLIFWPPKIFFKNLIFLPSCRAHSALQNIKKFLNLNDTKKSYGQNTAKNGIFTYKMGGRWQKINFLGTIGAENQKSENDVVFP